MNKVAAAILVRLHGLADVTNDGKVDRADLERIVQDIGTQTQHHPYAATIVAAAASAFFTWAVMRLAGC